MTKPATELRIMVQKVKQYSLKLNSTRPLAFTAFWPLWVFSSIRRISLTLKKPITTMTNWMPSDRLTLSKVKRYTPVVESTPTVARARPISAESRVLTGLSPTMPPRQAMAKIISTKYSAGPNATAHFARIGANSTTPQVAMILPVKELTADSDRAIPALP
jgi:hypothetical protein